MILNEITLKNFKTYKDITLRFNEGITIIIGENGVGKSTILEAIHYALFKKSFINQNDLIRHDEDSMEVTLSFTEKGNRYMIQRIRRNSQSSSTLYHYKNGGFNRIMEGNKEVDVTVRNIIGIDPDLFLNAIYVKQGEITNLISKSPAERKKIIGKLLKIDDLEKSWERIPSIIESYENQLIHIESLLEEKQYIEKEILQIQTELDISKKQCQELMDEKTSMKSMLEKTLSIKKRMEQNKTNHLLLSNNLSMMKFHLDELGDEYDALSSKLNNFEKIEQRIYIIKQKISDLNIPTMENEIIHHNSEVKILKHENASLKKALNELEKMEGKCPICQSEITGQKKDELIKTYESQMKQNKELIKEHNKNIKTKTHTITQGKQNQKDYENLNKELYKKQGAYERFQNLKKQINETKLNIKKLTKQLNRTSYDEKEYDNLMKQETSYHDKINKITERIGTLKGTINKNEERLNKLTLKIHNLQNLQNEIKNINEYITLLQEYRILYGKDGVQETIRRITKPIIQQNTKYYFEKFNFPYTDLFLTEDYEIFLYDKNKKININMLSGGEQVAASLALRLGITQSLTRKNIECLLLDEPTIHLDMVRVHELNNLLQKLQMIPQVIIVTHEQELGNSACNLIQIVKEKGTSGIITTE